MKIYITLLLVLLVSVSAYSQELRIEIDLRGNFATKIIIGEHSSLTLDQKGNIKSININSDSSCEDFDYGLESSSNSSNHGSIIKISGLDVEYDFFTKQISKIGDMEIKYDFHTKLVSEIDGTEFEYDFFTKKISEIGDVKIEYDFFTKKISEIGDVKFTYNFSSKDLKSIGNADFKHEFGHNNDRRKYRDHSNRVVFTYNGIRFAIKTR